MGSNERFLAEVPEDASYGVKGAVSVRLLAFGKDVRAFELILHFLAAPRFNRSLYAGMHLSAAFTARVKLKRPVRALTPGDDSSGQRLQAVEP